MSHTSSVFENLRCGIIPVWAVFTLLLVLILNARYVRLYVHAREVLKRHDIALSWFEYVYQVRNGRRLDEVAPEVAAKRRRELVFGYVLILVWLLAGMAIGLLVTVL